MRARASVVLRQQAASVSPSAHPPRSRISAQPAVSLHYRGASNPSCTPHAHSPRVRTRILPECFCCLSAYPVKQSRGAGNKLAGSGTPPVFLCAPQSPPAPRGGLAKSWNNPDIVLFVSKKSRFTASADYRWSKSLR